MRRARKRCVVSCLLFAALSLEGCPRDSSQASTSAVFQPSPAVKSGVLVLEDYSIYLADYKKHQVDNPPCTPFPLCSYTNRVFPPPGSLPGSTPSPQASGDPRTPLIIPSLVGLLVAPSSYSTDVPTYIENDLQSDFASMLKKVPPEHAPAVQDWSLKISDCSAGSKVIWLSQQTNANSHGGSICLSPLVIQAVFIQLTAGTVPEVAVNLLRYTNDPFGFNGDSKTLIEKFASTLRNQQLTNEDINALAATVDASVGQLASVSPALRDSINYLVAREIAMTYLSTDDENKIAVAAAALIQKPGEQRSCPALVSVLQEATGYSSNVNWGVSAVGDGQAVLAALNKLSSTRSAVSAFDLLSGVACGCLISAQGH